MKTKILAKKTEISKSSPFKQVSFYLFHFSVWILCFSVPASVFSQNIGINTTGNVAHSSAMLDVDASNKGMLIPRVSLSSITDVTTISSPANGLVVYNTNPSMSNGNGVGFYYYCSSGCTTTGWKFMAAADNGPGTSGQVLTSQGAGAEVKWATPVATSGGGGSTGCASCITSISNMEWNNIAWATCRQHCLSLTEGSFSDWRMPTFDEIVYYTSGTFSPPDGSWISGLVWTSTPQDARFPTPTNNNWMTLNENTGQWAGWAYNTPSISCRCVR